MGYAIYWAAMRDGKLRVTCPELGVKPTGKREEIPVYKIVGGELPSGCRLVFLNSSAFNERHLKQLSVSGEVNCFAEEHVMFSSATAWKCEAPLEIEGPGPAQLEEIKKKLLADRIAGGGEQAEVNFLFDAPIQLAQQLPGFRVDEEVPGVSGDFFQVLEPDEEKKHSNSGWFGRRVGKKDKE